MQSSNLDFDLTLPNYCIDCSASPRQIKWVRCMLRVDDGDEEAEHEVFMLLSKWAFHDGGNGDKGAIKLADRVWMLLTESIKHGFLSCGLLDVIHGAIGPYFQRIRIYGDCSRIKERAATRYFATLMKARRI